MGWTFSYSATEKKQIIADCTSDPRCIKKSVVGNELWTIWNTGNEKIIVLFLLARRDGCWGYKDMTEEMGPCYYKCPLSFLKEVPVASQPWRDRVLSYHRKSNKAKKISKTINIGDTVILSGSIPDRFRITSTSPRLLGMAGNGLTYKIIKSRIVEVC